MPPATGWFAVARDEQGISAFLCVRFDAANNALVADQMEIDYADGKPTVRGIRGGKALGDELHRRADEAGVKVCSPVVVENERHLKVLEQMGYVVRVLWLERDPMKQEP